MFVAIYSIFVFIFLGYFAKTMRMLGNKQGNILLGFLLNFALPSAIFNGAYHSEVSLELILTLLNALCCSLFSGVLFYFVALKILNRSKEIALAMAFLVILHNTLFLGIPMVRGALGEEAAHKAILLDQICTGIPLAILTPFLMSLSGKSPFRLRAIGVRLFQNPLFLAMISGFILKSLPFKIPDELFVPINALAACATPVGLFAIGVQLSFTSIKNEWRNSLIVLFVAMLFVPFVYFAYIQFLHYFFDKQITDDMRMALIELSMPPLISSAAVIMRAGLNQNLAIASIVLGIIASAFITPLWHHLSFM